jgi:hypothetical protein
MLNAREIEPALTEQEKLLRDYFVDEYLKDFDRYKACLRIGFQPSFADAWADKLFKDGYVQRKITFLTSRPLSGPEQDAQDRALVETTLRTVMLRGSDSARVAAARELNAMKGWSKPDDNANASDAIVDLLKQFAQKAPV